MKTVPALIHILGIVLLASCFTGPPKAALLGPVTEYEERNGVIEVIGYENAEAPPTEPENAAPAVLPVGLPAEMPEWVARYISTGTTGIETLPEYANRYVFIAKQTGGSLDSLKLWTKGFSLDRDFSRLVSARIQARFSGVAGGNPGEVFGRYFEEVVKNAANANFTGASLEGRFWIKKRISGDDGSTPPGETFEYYILVSIEKETLENQINLLLMTTQSDLPPTREQSAATVRLKTNFYTGF
jgi:hypothetical protein